MSTRRRNTKDRANKARNGAVPRQLRPAREPKGSRVRVNTASMHGNEALMSANCKALCRLPFGDDVAAPPVLPPLQDKKTANAFQQGAVAFSEGVIYQDVMTTTVKCNANGGSFVMCTDWSNAGGVQNAYSTNGIANAGGLVGTNTSAWNVGFSTYKGPALQSGQAEFMIATKIRVLYNGIPVADQVGAVTAFDLAMWPGTHVDTISYGTFLDSTTFRTVNGNIVDDSDEPVAFFPGATDNAVISGAFQFAGTSSADRVIGLIFTGYPDQTAIVLEVTSWYARWGLGVPHNVRFRTDPDAWACFRAAASSRIVRNRKKDENGEAKREIKTKVAATSLSSTVGSLLPSLLEKGGDLLQRYGPSVIQSLLTL